jgi:hypothetical protein
MSPGAQAEGLGGTEGAKGAGPKPGTECWAARGDRGRKSEGANEPRGEGWWPPLPHYQDLEIARPVHTFNTIQLDIACRGRPGNESQRPS